MASVRFFQLVNSVLTQANSLATTADRTGIAKTGATIWLLGPSTVPMYRWAAPFTLKPILQGWVGIYTGGSFVSAVPGIEHVPSAVTWGTSGTVWVATTENDLFQISASGQILSSVTMAPYTGQDSGVPLGVSALLWWQGGLYAASAFNGLLAKLT